ncbi:MAG: hypothetical protein AAGJ81_10115 [Verrucomicrobiota bacterium]
MKHISSILPLTLILLNSNLAGETPEPLPAEELSWFYTLAVQRGPENFSFSLMKEGWLAFDTWSDGDEMKENRIEISAAQFSSLKDRFENLFEYLESVEFENSNDDFSYAFERVTDSVTTLEFSGNHPKLTNFLNELSKTSGMPLPFQIE